MVSNSSEPTMPTVVSTATSDEATSSHIAKRSVALRARYSGVMRDSAKPRPKAASSSATIDSANRELASASRSAAAAASVETVGSVSSTIPAPFSAAFSAEGLASSGAISMPESCRRATPSATRRTSAITSAADLPAGISSASISDSAFVSMNAGSASSQAAIRNSAGTTVRRAVMRP
ncbi:MAG: hypothetical protein ACD_54C00817G0002 [uncultured bacterium]|nr:MAG: hypothetical protein ACD_54C00817G0002 [uncultured bacterium]